MNTEARQRIQVLIGVLMAEYCDKPDWERVARVLAEVLTLASAPGVDPAQVGLAATAAAGFVKRVELGEVLERMLGMKGQLCVSEPKGTSRSGS